MKKFKQQKTYGWAGTLTKKKKTRTSNAVVIIYKFIIIVDEERIFLYNALCYVSFFFSMLENFFNFHIEQGGQGDAVALLGEISGRRLLPHIHPSYTYG